MIFAAIGHRAVMSLIRLYQTFTYAVATIFVGVVESKMADFYRQAGVKVVKSKKEMTGSDIAILDKRYYPSVVAYKSLGTADTYLNGYWECEDLEEHFYKLLLSKGYRTLLKPHDIFINYLQFQLFNLQTAPRSWEVGKKHYDLGE